MGIGSRQSSAHKLKFPRDAHCQVTHPLWFHESYGWALEQYYRQTRDITKSKSCCFSFIYFTLLSLEFGTFFFLSFFLSFSLGIAGGMEWDLGYNNIDTHTHIYIYIIYINTHAFTYTYMCMCMSFLQMCEI